MVVNACAVVNLNSAGTGQNAVPSPLAAVPPPVSVPAEFNHWDQLSINAKFII